MAIKGSKLNVFFTTVHKYFQIHNTTNQLFTLKAPEGSGYNYYYVNAGNIQNTGIEASVSINYAKLLYFFKNQLLGTRKT